MIRKVKNPFTKRKTESAAKIKAILNATNDVLILVDVDGIIEAVNTAAAESLGKAAEELIGSSVYGIIESEIEDRRKAKASQVIETGQAIRFEDERNGKWFDQCYYPVFDDHGKVIQLAVFARNITAGKESEIKLAKYQQQLEEMVKERTAKLEKTNQELQKEILEHRLTEEKLKRSQELYQQIVEMQEELICRFLPDGTFTFVNEAISKRLERETREIIGQNVFQYVHPEDQNQLRDKIASASVKKPIENSELRVILPNGEIRWEQWTGHAFFDQENNIIEIQAVGRDITKRKEVEAALKNSEQGLADIINFLPDPTFVIDQEGKVIKWNKSMEELTGVEADTIVGKGDLEYTILFYGEKKPFLIDLVLKPFEEIKKINPNIKKEKDTLFLETYVPAYKEGSYFWAKARPLYDAQKQIVGAIETIRDITELKNMEEAFAESKEWFRVLVENLPDYIITIDPEGVITYLNRTKYSSPEKIIGTCAFDYLEGKTLEKYKSVLEQVYLTKKPAELEIEIAKYTPQPLIINCKLIPIESEGKINEVMIIASDITARKKMEETLKEIEIRNRFLVESIGGFIYIYATSQDYRIEYMSKSVIERTGYDATGEYCYKILHGLDRVCPFCVNERVYAGETVKWEIESPKDNRWYYAINYPKYNNDGSVSKQAIILDITARKKMEEELRKNEARYRAVVEDQTELICRYQAGGILTFVNEAYCRYFGKTVDDLIGSSFTPLIFEEDRKEVEKAISKMSLENPVVTIQERVIMPNGKIHWQEWTNRAIYDAKNKLVEYQAVGRDITERKQAEAEKQKLVEQMHQAQKLESLGFFAGGIAHDFNNLLVGVLGNASLIKSKIDPKNPDYQKIQDIISASERAAELCNQMLAYSGRTPLVVTELDLSQEVRNILQLIKASITKKANIQCILEENLPLIKADSSQIRQIIMNLVLNASEAFIAQDQPFGVDLRPTSNSKKMERPLRIVIKTGFMDFNRAYLKGTYIDDQLPEGTYVFLEVEDNGCGMDAKIKEKIFDPFFTTKFTGRGLGLAAVLGIIRGHRGAIKVDSKLGEGSTFRVLFPSAGFKQLVKPRVEKITPVLEKWKGRGKVLVVDDELLVRETAADMISSFGFEVLKAKDGLEAIQILKKSSPSDIVLILLDLTMPLLNGKETLQEIKKIRKEVPVILTSGYSEQMAASSFKDKDFDDFIQKPYQLHELREKIIKILAK